MDNKLIKEDFKNAIDERDKEVLDIIKQCTNESAFNIDSDEEKEADINAIWYYNTEANKDNKSMSIQSWNEYYDSESFNRQVKLEIMWNGIEKEEKDGATIETDNKEDYNQDLNSDSDIKEEEYNWQEMLRSGYSDPNGGSPQ